MSNLDAIKEIEKTIGKELKLCPPDADIMKRLEGYLLNERQELPEWILKFNLEITTSYFYSSFKSVRLINKS